MAVASVRTATVEDVVGIARLQLVTWRAAYPRLLPAGALEAFSERDAAAAWARALAQDGGHLVLVATEGPHLVGFCAAGPASTDDVSRADGSLPEDSASTVALSALLVEPRWGRRGHGHRLFEAATERLRARGATRGLAWVPEQDVASKGFYDRVGWEPDGTVRTLDAEGHPLRELRLTGALEE